MLEEQDNQLKQNKGFSLVELLVAMAVGSIVLAMVMAFLSSGLRNFTKQSQSINLQNELQEVSNAVTEAIMEANVITVTRTDNNLYLVLLDEFTTDAAGAVVTDSDGNYTFTGKNTAKAIMFDADESTVYVLDTVGYNKLFNAKKDESVNLKGYAYSTYVRAFSISRDGGTYTGNGTVIDIDITVSTTESATDAISDHLQVTTRNKLEYTE